MTPAETGGFTSTFDVAELALYAFFLFFALLVYYLRREDKRDGYPLVSERSGRVSVQGFPAVPPVKVFNIGHEGPVALRPRGDRDVSAFLAPTAPWPGAPAEPTGDPMRDGVGPAAYANRADVPDLTFDEHLPKIVPLRAAPGYYLAEEDPDPRGMDVVTADGVAAGVVRDAWVDRSETFVRFLEVEVAAPAGTLPAETGESSPAVALGPAATVRPEGESYDEAPSAPPLPVPPRDADAGPAPAVSTEVTSATLAPTVATAAAPAAAAITVGRGGAGRTRRVLLPMSLVRIDAGRRRVLVSSVLSRQLAEAPATRHPEQVTLQEEDRLYGYYAGGHMYATADRSEPLL